MFSSSELIEALRRRRRRSLRPERAAGEFPEGWSAWFAALAARAGTIRGATADSILAIFLAREPRLPPAAVAELGRWRAFASLWRQQWHPAGQDERSLRILATVVSLLLHILFSVMLIWLMYARFLVVGSAEDALHGDDAVQVEFIGEGTPAEQGGGPAQGETPADMAAAAQPAAPDTSAQPAATALPEPSVASQVEAVETTPSPPEPQPLQVTETAAVDSQFVLPPPRAVDVPNPPVAVPELSSRPREIVVVEVPQPQPPERALPQREISVPDLQQRPVEVAVREIPAALPQLQRRPVPQPRIAAPELSAEAPGVRSREIPSPADAGQASSATAGTRDAAPGTSAGSAATAPAGTAGGRPDAAGGTRPAQSGSGSGASASAREGAIPGPRRADDWGDSTRNRPGGQAGGGTPGLFNPDGSPRLGAGDGRSGGGLPPGTITEDFEKIDRMGTWLKRPPIGYEPTSFDRFWVPHETLLEEWVRRNIREVMVPIPGTSKKLRCVVSLLQLGGGCGITDPNKQDVEAGAREPPEVPFKRELQEDQDALRDPAPTP